MQLTLSDQIRVGDWIEAPKFGADGDVIEVGLHYVRVRNWDRSITTIPTHKLSQESFVNWRGMFEGGGRRIKRSILIDQTSIRFLDQDLFDHLRGIELLRVTWTPRLRKSRAQPRHNIQASVVNGRH